MFRDNIQFKNLIDSHEEKFLNNYWATYKRILFESRDDETIVQIKKIFKKVSKDGGKIIFVGNGASASLSSHAATDFTKQAKIEAIAFNDHNLITALSNDYGYEFWVSKAIELYSANDDMLIFISVSGESKNLINGIDFANKNNLKTASLTGSKENNKLRSKSDTSLWVDSKAYNIVESIHTIWITLIIDMFVGHPEYTVNE